MMIIRQSTIRKKAPSKIDIQLAKFPLNNNCIHCGYPNYRHLIYSDENGCIYDRDSDWDRMNEFKVDNKGVLINKENKE